MIIDIGPKFYSALLPPYDLGVKVIYFKINVKVLPQSSYDLVVTQLLFNHTIYIWYTDSSYGRCSSCKIIFSTMSSSLHPPHPSIPSHALPPPPPPPPPPSNTHIHTMVLDFKVIILLFLFDWQARVQTSILSSDRSCLVRPYVTFNYSRTSMARTPLGPWKFVRDSGSSSLGRLL